LAKIFFALHLTRRQLGSSFNQCDVIGGQICRFRWNSPG